MMDKKIYDRYFDGYLETLRSEEQQKAIARERSEGMSDEQLDNTFGAMLSEAELQDQARELAGPAHNRTQDENHLAAEAEISTEAEANREYSQAPFEASDLGDTMTDNSQNDDDHGHDGDDGGHEM